MILTINIEGIKHRDPKACKEAHQTITMLLYTKYGGTLGYHECEDIASETMIALWESRNEIESSGFARVVAERIAIKRCRRLRRLGRALQRLTVTSSENDGGESVLEGVEGIEHAHSVFDIVKKGLTVGQARLLSQLCEFWRQHPELRYKGLFKAHADAAECSYDAVRTQWVRTVDAVRAMITSIPDLGEYGRSKK